MFPTIDQSEVLIVSDRPSVLITGASTGIGEVYAERFARRGHDLVLVARNMSRLDAVAARLREETGVTIDIIQADLSEIAGIEAVETRLRKDHAIGVLINNAVGNLRGGFLDQTAEDMARLVALNTTAVLRLARAFAPRFAEARTGAIVTI